MRADRNHLASWARKNSRMRSGWVNGPSFTKSPLMQRINHKLAILGWAVIRKEMFLWKKVFQWSEAADSKQGCGERKEGNHREAKQENSHTGRMKRKGKENVSDHAACNWKRKRKKTVTLEVIKDNSPIGRVYIGVCRNFYAGFHEIWFV